MYANSDWWLNKLTDPCFNNWEKWVAEWNASVGLTCSRFSDFTTSGAMWQFSDYGKSRGSTDALTLTIPTAPSDRLSLVDRRLPMVCTSWFRARRPQCDSTLMGACSTMAQMFKIWSSNGSKAQRWRFTYDGQGYYTITGYDSGKALDVVGAGTASGTNVQQYASMGPMRKSGALTATATERIRW